MGVPCSLQAYICLIPALGNLNLDKIPSSRASVWESLRWVRTRLAQKAVVMQKFPGQPSSLPGGDNRLVSMSQIVTACNFSAVSRMLWHSFGKHFLRKLRGPKEWLLLVVVAMCVTFCSDVIPEQWEGLEHLFSQDKLFCVLPAELEKPFLLYLKRRHLVCKQLS